MVPVYAPPRPLSLIALAIAATSCGGAEDLAAAPAATPNVLLIVADDVGWADVPGFGDDPLEAPALARLAAEGVVHRAAYAAASVCSPARAALLTGRYPQRFGHENNTGDLERQRRDGIGLPVGVPTLVEALRARGYATGLVGKWHLGANEPFHPLARGFDEFFGFLGGGHDYFVWNDVERGAILRGREAVAGDEYLTDAFAREASAFLARHAERPFFLVLAPNAVHPPLQAPDDLFPPQDPALDETRRAYRAAFTGLDRALGRVLDELDRLELTDRTLVAFLGDNGGAEENGARNGPFRAGKRSPYEGGLRIPLVVRFPGGVRAGEALDDVVSALDVGATILAATGAELGEGLAPDGVDLAGPIDGSRALFWRQGRSGAMREGRWKLVTRGVRPPELYDLVTDPGESKNVAAANAQVVARLRERYSGWEEGLVEPLWNWRD